MVDADDGCVILGTPHGEATVDAEYDLLNNSRGSVFVQGMTDENSDDGNGCVMAISNLSAGTKADGLGIVLGRDIQASFGFTSGLFGYQQVGETAYVGTRNIEWVYQLLFPKLCRFKQLLDCDLRWGLSW